MKTLLGSMIIVQSILLLSILLGAAQRLAPTLAAGVCNPMLAVSVAILPLVSFTLITILANDLLHWLHSPHIVRVLGRTIGRRTGAARGRG